MTGEGGSNATQPANEALDVRDRELGDEMLRNPRSLVVVVKGRRFRRASGLREDKDASTNN